MVIGGNGALLIEADMNDVPASMSTAQKSDEKPAKKALRQDVLAGALFIAFGAFGYVFSLQLSLGTPSDFGSAFFPRVVSVLLILLGAGIAIGGLASSHAPIERASLKPLVLVTICVVLFAATLEYFGIVVAIMLMVAVAGFAAERMTHPLRTLLLGAGLSFVCVAIFIWGAKLPIRVWPF